MDGDDACPGRDGAYLNFVADRLDLRRDIRFSTDVVAMTFDEEAAEWAVETAAGEVFAAPFVVAASGILSVPLEPDIPGMETFAGASLFTSRWPKECVDLTGGRRHRNRFDGCATHTSGRAGGRTAVCVPAFAGVHVAVAGPGL